MSEVPRSFRRESRLFLWVALGLILFLNLSTLLFLRASVAWGSQQTERRAAEVLRRLSAAADSRNALERAASESDVVFVAFYDAAGRRARYASRGLEAPESLPTDRPEPGRFRAEWRTRPSLLIASLAIPDGFLAAAFDPGIGGAMRSTVRGLTILIPVAGAILVVLALIYLRSLLHPYERLLAAAGAAPQEAQAGKPPADERDFLIARFESTIAALSRKEQELERLARAEKERADDLEIAARTLARNLPTGLLSVDSDGLIIELNESGREILDLPEAVRGKPCAEALAGIPDLRDAVLSVLHDHANFSRREIHWRQGEQEHVVGVTATPATGGDGRFLGVLALFTDVSHVRRLESRVALARHLADLGHVSAGAAHEFRNAAAAIDGFADLAMRHPERAAEHLKAIRHEAQEMSRVTSDFLLFARPESFVPDQVSLVGVTETAAEDTERTFPDVRVERGGEFPEVPGSSVLLRRALVNLLRNAVEATPPERRAEADAIALVGETRGREVLLSIGDRGPGVEPSQREKVFLPFYSTKREGIGFGLAIVARIAELHGGTVEVAPRRGGGSLFTLRIPTGAGGTVQPGR
ncbi:MAG TPA: ATP-binding protein [Thermoanaerobaculia bacterium]|nr:ATP-binding protein [Thermoanaerobaculia bacterium]